MPGASLREPNEGEELVCGISFRHHLRSSEMRRSSPRLIICSAMLCLLFACSGKTEDPHGTVTVKFWHSFVASTAPALNLLIRTFEEEHPGIKVNAQYIPAGDALVQKLVTAIHSNTAPDISWIHSDFLDKLVEADAIYPMDHFLH